MIAVLLNTRPLNTGFMQGSSVDPIKSHHDVNYCSYCDTTTDSSVTTVNSLKDTIVNPASRKTSVDLQAIPILQHHGFTPGKQQDSRRSRKHIQQNTGNGCWSNSGNFAVQKRVLLRHSIFLTDEFEQNFAPVKRVCAHLNAFHAYADDPKRAAVEANHYCAHLNDEVRQCILYDSPEPGARIIGIGAHTPPHPSPLYLKVGVVLTS